MATKEEILQKLARRSIAELSCLLPGEANISSSSPQPSPEPVEKAPPSPPTAKPRTSLASSTVAGTVCVILHDHGSRKIAVIKAIRRALGLSLLVAKRYSETPGQILLQTNSERDALQLRDSIQEAGGQVEVTGLLTRESAPIPDVRDGETLHLVLVRHGIRKIQVIKAIRNTTGVGLKEAKQLAETTGAILLSTSSTQALQTFRDQLEKLEAEVKVLTDAEVELEQNRQDTTYANSDNRYRVRLRAIGPRKILLIKHVRSLANLGLREAKALVESNYPLLMKDLSQKHAQN
ncbi:MAG: ribosomal protein L7/L12 [Myxococcota bacterium]